MIAQRARHRHRIARLAGGAGGDLGGDLHLGAGILDRADQPGGGGGGVAHRDRRLFRRGGDLAGLAQHPARRGGRARRLGAQLQSLARGILHGQRDAVAELRRQPVALDLRAVRAIAVVDFDGDLALQRGQPHQRVDQFQQLGIARGHRGHQHGQRHAVAGADHRQQRHRRHPGGIGGRDRALDRVDPRPLARVEEAVAQELASQIDHPVVARVLPRRFGREAMLPMFPIGARNLAHARLQQGPGGARAVGKPAVGIEDAEPLVQVERGGDRSDRWHILGHEALPCVGDRIGDVRRDRLRQG